MGRLFRQLADDASTGQNPGTLGRKLSRCKEGMEHFLPSWYKFYCVLVRSRYKFDRSREFVTVQDLNCGQMRVSGRNGYYEFVLAAGAKAKIVTNNLPIALSVL
jgi:hypothetical protein